MPGLLSQEQPQEQAPVQQESVAPGEAEQTSMLDGISDEAKPIMEKMINAAYSEDNFPKMVGMFKEGGVEQFPKTMSVAINSILDRVEGEEKLSDEALSEVGASLFEMLVEDVVGSGVVQGVTPEIMSQAAGETLNMWAQKNPERFNQEEFAQLIQQEMQAEGGQEAMGGEPQMQEQAPQGQPGLLSGGMA